MANEFINGTGDVNMFQLLKHHIMDLAYGMGEDDDFDAIVEINKDIEGLRIRMQDLDSERDNYKRLLFKTRLENDKLKEQIEKLQKENEELEGRLDTALFHLEDRTVY